MIPILYEASETAFTTNGLGRLRDCITCKVTEERNGVYECDFEYPVDGANYDQIRLGRIIAVEHDDTSDLQPFDIVSSTEPLDGIVSFHAVHISYRLTKAVAMGTNITTLADAFAMLQTAQPSSIFTFWTDKTSSGFMSSADGTPRSVRQFLGGVEGSILDTYGGEYEWDKFTVKLWNARGTDRDFTIRYGVNLVDFNRETDCSETYNAVVPYWKNDTALIVGDMVSVEQGTRTECVPLDLSEKFEEQPNKAQVEAMAQSLLNSNQPYLPSQNIEVDFVRLQDSEEYSALANLYKCNLCDYIRVEFPKYNMSGRFKIVRTVYDVLLERYESMELGNLSTTLSEALGVSNNDGSSTSKTSITFDSTAFPASTGFEPYTTDVYPVLNTYGNVCTLYGAVKPTASVTMDATQRNLFTLPAGYRPTQVVAQVCQASARRVFLLRIETTGEVSVSRLRDTNSSSYSSASTTEWLPFTVTYVV